MSNKNLESENRNAQIVKYVVEVGSRRWTVIPKEDSEYIVQYPDKDKSQVVNLDESHCTGTYFQYNDSCPHIEACQEVHEQRKDDDIQDSTTTIDATTPVHIGGEVEYYGDSL